MKKYTSTFIVLLLPLTAPLLVAETVDYTYDAAGRLVQTAYGGGAGIAYAYDANGNLVARLTSRPAGTNYVVTTIWNAGGHITPANPVVAAGANQTLSIIASNGYVLAEVRVNNVSVGAPTSYTFTNIRAHQTLAASYAPAGGCQYALAPARTNISLDSQSGAFTLTTDAACAWNAASASIWLHLAPTSGVGNALIAFTAAENTSGATRTGTVQVAAQTMRVVQSAQHPTPTPTPTPFPTPTPTPAPPPAPTAQPATAVDETGFTANWTTAPGATNYFLDVSYAANFSTFLDGYHNRPVGPVATHRVAIADFNAVCYYRLFGQSEHGIGATSNVRRVALPRGMLHWHLLLLSD